MIYDVVIVGGGPAGLSAGLYASRARLNTLIIEKGVDGGQISGTNEVENYPGSIENASGPSLIARMVDQAESFGVKKVSDEILEIDFSGKIKSLVGQKDSYQAKTVIIATGAVSRPMGVPGEEEFTGRGVSYCVTCDGPFFQDLETFVIGGGDAAVEEAIFLSKFAKKVTIVHRRDELRAAKSIQEKAFANEKIEFMWDTVVKKMEGNMMLEKLTLENTKTGQVTLVDSGEIGPIGVFVYIGFIPSTGLFNELIDMEKGYIVTDDNMNTNIQGVYAAGDNRVKMVRQVVTAAADGAIAAISAEKYIEANFE